MLARSMNLSASVLLPWSIWAIMQKLRMSEMSCMKQMYPEPLHLFNAGLHIAIFTASIILAG
jgi:hypothetical protein